MSAGGTYELVVSEARRETPTVGLFKLDLPAGTDFSFKPGQSMLLNFPGEPKVSRAYSIASSPLEKGFVEFALKRAGEFSARLFALRRGDRLIGRGPYGKWTYSDEVPHAVLITGGTGIGPVRGIARYVVQKGLPNRLTILYSSRTPSDIIFRRDLEELSARPNVRVFHTMTRPQLMKPGEDWDGWTGRLDLARIREAVPDFDRAHYFMCGPNQLIEGLSGALSAAGIPRARIRYEKWGEF